MGPGGARRWRRAARAGAALASRTGAAGADGPANLAEAVATACSSDAASRLSLLEGCGMRAVLDCAGFTSSTRVFDVATGALLGLDVSSDGPRSRCLVYRSVAGVAFVGEDAVECPLCDGDQPRLDGRP